MCCQNPSIIDNVINIHNDIHSYYLTPQFDRFNVVRFVSLSITLICEMKYLIHMYYIYSLEYEMLHWIIRNILKSRRMGMKWRRKRKMKWSRRRRRKWRKWRRRRRRKRRRKKRRR